MIYKLSMILGPACWFADLLVSYALQPYACARAPWLLPPLSGLFMLPLLLCWVAGLRALPAVRRAHGGTPFIATVGVLLPLVFLAALIWSALAASLFHACQ